MSNWIDTKRIEEYSWPKDTKAKGPSPDKWKNPYIDPTYPPPTKSPWVVDNDDYLQQILEYQKAIEAEKQKAYKQLQEALKKIEMEKQKAVAAALAAKKKKPKKPRKAPKKKTVPSVPHDDNLEEREV